MRRPVLALLALIAFSACAGQPDDPGQEALNKLAEQVQQIREEAAGGDRSAALQTIGVLRGDVARFASDGALSSQRSRSILSAAASVESLLKARQTVRSPALPASTAPSPTPVETVAPEPPEETAQPTVPAPTQPADNPDQGPGNEEQTQGNGQGPD
ncbi:MAG: hypothetical protein ACRDIU_10570 [Actinomycetota bacterium]